MHLGTVLMVILESMFFTLNKSLHLELHSNVKRIKPSVYRQPPVPSPALLTWDLTWDPVSALSGGGCSFQPLGWTCFSLMDP